MSTFRKLASDTALYGISTILGRMLNFVLVPIQTYVFENPSELSSNVELYSYVAVLLAIYTLGLETAFFRFAARNKAETGRVLNETLSIVLVVSGLFTGLIIALAPQITVWLNYPGQQQFVVWMALIVAIDAIVAIPFARLRVEGNARAFVKAKVINIVLVVFLNVFFLIICRDIYAGKYLAALRPVIGLIYSPTIGPGYIFLANLLGNACYFLLIRRAFSGFRFRFRLPEVRAVLAYAFPIMLTSLAGLVNATTDRIFLRHWLPNGFYAGLTREDVLGVYGNCFKLSVFMALAVQSFKFAADPFFFSQSTDKNAPGGGPPVLLAQVTKWFIIVCVLIWLGVSLNMDVIGLLISKRYRVGLDIVPLLLLANLLLGVYYNISFWFKLSDRTAYGTYITLIGAATTIGLNYWLIPVLGYMGCAIAFLVSSLVMLLLCYGLGERHYPVPYAVGSAVWYIGSAGVLIYANSLISILDWRVAVPYHLALFGLYLGLIVATEWPTFRPVWGRLRGIARR